MNEKMKKWISGISRFILLWLFLVPFMLILGSAVIGQMIETVMRIVNLSPGWTSDIFIFMIAGFVIGVFAYLFDLG
jgi:hypothetical protein